MFINKVINFNNGFILKSEMLACISDFSKNFSHSIFEKFSDGIICGTKLLIRESNIIVMPGIIKHKSKLYISAEKYELPFYATGRETIIKIRFIDKAVRSDFEIYNTEIFLDEDTVIKKDELELGKYVLEVGQELKIQEECFKSFKVNKNKINILNVYYAGIHKATLNPLILKVFTKEMLQKKNLDINDIAFCMNCLNQNVIEREEILFYIKQKKRSKEKDYSNEDIYIILSEILENT